VAPGLGPRSGVIGALHLARTINIVSRGRGGR
jgi:hypothetical protein